MEKIYRIKDRYFYDTYNDTDCSYNLETDCPVETIEMFSIIANCSDFEDLKEYDFYKSLEHKNDINELLEAGVSVFEKFESLFTIFNYSFEVVEFEEIEL